MAEVKAECNAVEDFITHEIEFGFGLAIGFLKDGHKVARAGWNGKGMWLKLVNPNGFASNYVGMEGISYELLSWIGMKTADNKFVPWLASQTDVLAEDWVVV